MDGRPIANKYREGKMKRTLKRELKSAWNCWEGSFWLGFCGWCVEGVGGSHLLFFPPALSAPVWDVGEKLSRFCWIIVFSNLAMQYYVLDRVFVLLVGARRCVYLFAIIIAAPPEMCWRWPSQQARLETRTKESSRHASIWDMWCPKNAQWKQQIGQGLFVQHQHQMFLFFLKKKKTKVCLLGPERWWTMPEQGEARGNSGGGS